MNRLKCINEIESIVHNLSKKKALGSVSLEIFISIWRKSDIHSLQYFPENISWENIS